MVLYVPVNFEEFCRPPPYDMFQPFGGWRRRSIPCRPRLAFGRPAGCYWMVPKEQNEVDKKENFDAKIALEGFKPEEVKVQLKPESRTLLVTAKQEKSEEGFKMSRNVQRSVFIPEEFDLEKVQSKMGEDGVLKIRAERIQKEIEKKTEAQEEQMQVENEKPEAEQQAEVVNVEMNVAEQEKNEEQAKDDDAASFELVNDVVQGMQDVMGEDEDKPKEQQPEPFKCAVNVSNFAPEEISVEVTDSGRLRVSAAHEEVDVEDGSSSVSRMSKEFKVDGEKFDLDQLKSTLSKEGILTVEAPAKAPTKQGVVNIPVNIL